MTKINLVYILYIFPERSEVVSRPPNWLLGAKNYFRKENIMTEKLKQIQNHSLTYKQLCEALDIPIKSGKSKIYQIKNIALYCNLQILSHPTRYVITEVYDQSLLPSKSKFQAPIEILIMQLFKANNFETLYLTNSRLLEYMKLVNSNYRIIKNPKLRKKLPFETEYLYTGASKSGEILMKWLGRALEKMESSSLLMWRKGFCLVKKNLVGEHEYTSVINVPLDSQLEKDIMECQRQAFIKLNLQYDKQHRWVPIGMKAQYQAQFDREIYKMFDGAFSGGFQVNVLTPNVKGIKEVLTAYESEQIINQEAQRKIKETTQLNYLTGDERDKLIKEIIMRPPSIDYQYILQ